jgi:hypothetical protein
VSKSLTIAVKIPWSSCQEEFHIGDNESVVNSSNIPAGKLHKRHIAQSWHRGREPIAAKILYFIHIPGAIQDPKNVVAFFIDSSQYII